MSPLVAKEKIGTLLLASEMPVPISRLRTVELHVSEMAKIFCCIILAVDCLIVGLIVGRWVSTSSTFKGLSTSFFLRLTVSNWRYHDVVGEGQAHVS